jgi:hypothetical protein
MYQSLSTFLFRTPFFSYSNLSDFDTKQHESVFREMLQIATPDLSLSMEKGEDSTQYSAYRYYQRACTRSTPFGLFAGCSMGTIGERTETKISEQKDYRRVTRLDMNFICMMIQQIERDRSIREQLYYYHNTSLYSVGNHLRYVECHYLKLHRVHQITKVENSEYLQNVFSLTKTGARFSELVASLTDDGITADVASEFIHDLIDAQVLVSELEPAVTNVQPLTTLIAKLKALPNVNKNLVDVLLEIEAQLINIDRLPIGNTLNRYPAIIQNIEKTNIETEIKYLFQADMFKPVQQATVSHRILQDIKQALIFLNKINLPVARDNLTQFRENFIKRYGDREISMLFVLDNELGIGYANNTSGDISPLVDDLIMPESVSSPTKSLPIQSILMQRYQQSSQKIIELTDGDVKGSEAVWEDLQPTFSVVCQILQDDDQRRSVYIQSVGGLSASGLLGRFCHLDDQILNHTLDITQKEASMNPDVIYAEIVHLPESRIGNILLRPVLRPYEISYLAKSGVPDEFEIKPDDLYVSIKNNRIVLCSKRLNKEIVPRMSTAHNYSGQNSMPVYHFLCDLQHQNRRSGLRFQWNDAARQLDYLPRVVYKNCILSQACWLVHEKEIKAFTGMQNDNELLLKVKDWQIGRNIPDRALFADGDNKLYIDMNNPLSIRAWLSVVKKRSVFRLEEFLFDPETAVVRGPEGVFTNEFIFAFYRKD